MNLYKLFVVSLITICVVQLSSQSYYKTYDNFGQGDIIVNRLMEDDATLIGVASSFVSGTNLEFTTKFTSYDKNSGDVLFENLIYLADTVRVGISNTYYSDETVFAVGATHPKGSGLLSYDVLLLAISNSGELQYAKTIGTDDSYEVGWDIEVTEDFAYILASRDLNAGTTIFSVVHKINKYTGDLIWSTEVRGSLTTLSSAGITIDDQGNTYICGSEDSFLPTITNMIVTKISADGDMVWQAKFDDADRTFAEDIVVSSEGSLIISAYRNNNNVRDFSMARLDKETGAMLWEETYGENGFGFYQTNLEPLENGNIAMVYNINNRPKLIVIDPIDGQVKREVEYDIDQLFNSGLTELSDGSLVTSGSCISSSSECEYWVFKTQEDYTLSNSMITLDKQQISVFPNPVDNTLTIDLPSERIVTSQIFDSSGKLVMSVFTDSVNEIEVGSLKSGFYLLILTSENLRTYDSKFVKK